MITGRGVESNRKTKGAIRTIRALEYHYVFTLRKELAFGEVTGHAHRIDLGELFETKDGKLYLKVKELDTLSHEEHTTKSIDSGVYLVGIKRQYIPDGWESVRD